MNIVKEVRTTLSKPFPIRDSRSSYLLTTLMIGVFVALFLFFFRPFGLSFLDSGVLKICIGYGAITVVSIFLYDLLISIFFIGIRQQEYFTFGKWILYMIGLLTFIGFANFYYSKTFLGYFEWGALPRMMIATVAVGIFPAILFGGMSLLRAERKFQQISEEINEHINSEEPLKGKEGVVFGIDAKDIRYIEALQNYVRIAYTISSGELKEKVERATLKTVSDKLSGGSILKCHRSFLVNTNHISSSSGNAQGLVLTLNDCDKGIPVSRSHVPKFRT